MNMPLKKSETEAANCEAAHCEVVSSDQIRKDKKKALRKKAFAGLLAGVALAGGLYYGYDTLIGARYVTTDNAYVGAEVANVTPLIGGPVRTVLVSDTQQVKQGDVLVTLDDTDARLAVAQAEASLAQAERRVRATTPTMRG